VYLQTLRLFNFRNLVNATVEFAPGLNLVSGRNGQGKTNLVEAIHFLSLSRSFRTSALQELVRWGEDAASVFAKIRLALDGNQTSQVELGASIQNGKRSLFVNGNKVSSLSDFVGRLVCVTFSPTDLAIVKGSPAGRRRFIDKHLVDLRPVLIEELLNYQRAVANKSALLKAGIEDDKQLDSWDAVLAGSAARIVNARHEFLASLAAQAQPILERFAPGDTPLALNLESKLLGEEGAEVTAEHIIEKLRKNRSREIRYKSCLIGPHRDDVEILLAGHDARAYASQGQARTIVLCLKLAVISLLEANRRDEPVVLLDDVDSELDRLRVKALFESVLARSRQIFITGTGSRSELPLADYEVLSLKVEGGTLVQE
jgi:DNA replication and repair protein RecF